MRLINTETLQLQEFYGTIPIYAILSHTWGDEEPSLEDFRDPAGSSAGHKKIHAACRQACADGLEYLWVDTCCIMKSSSAELSEAINSMFRWYKEAKVCYVYLVDFECQQGPPIDPFGPESDISKCRWFTRGWTLQELIAPRDVRFYDKAWRFIGRKSDSMIKISNITGIDPVVLADSSRDNLDNCPVARRMSWAARRQTTRPEDMAYCLMGLFDVNMPMLYGEGEKAFLRLQEEVIKRSNDLSMFAWKDSAEDHEPTGHINPQLHSPVHPIQQRLELHRNPTSHLRRAAGTNGAMLCVVSRLR
ncbi:HET-domain-containing protein [Podospora aff. communis PSN243]|uniref:HET-domain-containing protein n=1 Tax=Podospora aff. communis PSN243 TaxID=3040156 RepID=A0AAV9GH08_9PEZI|nr:HET-domain-containing protein [Podospora aff. communis PSN243]